MKDLSVQLQQLRAQNLYRSRRVLAGPQGAEVVIDGRRYLAFCSNDYLGLANHPDLIRAFQSAAERYGVGSGAAHLISGHSHEHHALEEDLAEFTERPRALLFSTGYMANLGVISALLGRGDTVYEDRLNHASLLDGGLLSGARLRRYVHADVQALASRLADRDGGEALIATDGVFSMDGDLAPLPALAQVANEHGAWLMVDDAHGFGVIGREGKGSLNHYGLGLAQVPIVIGTLGKAFGTAGAFVAGSEEVIETLIQKARTYIFTTATPPALAAATRVSLRLARQEEWRREKLRALVGRFRAGAGQLGLSLLESWTPIQPLLIGDAGRAVALSEALRQQGILIGAIRPPTVPVGTARLRITFSAAHSEQQVDRLLDALEVVLAHPPPGDT
ncbi:MAG TPA: 8-amino-7-oxononanoate synthase [Candidatus Competibacteraceae bacterium]|nr:8-amino-7-oxononanoate synthase [Candidatus Competibacteraceae bacterium]